MKFDIGWAPGVSIYHFFEIFRYLDYYNAEDYTFYIREDIGMHPGMINEKLLMIKNIYETYDNFFHHNIKFPEVVWIPEKDMPPPDPEGTSQGFFESKKHFQEWRQRYTMSAHLDPHSPFSLSTESFWKIKSPNPDKKYVTISLINDERKNQKYYQYLTTGGRTILSEAVDFLLDNLCHDDNVKNLGDSRKFKTSQELIEKIELIRQSKFYIGSKCSWRDVAGIFEIPVLVIEENTFYY